MWRSAKQLLKLQADAWTTGKWWKATVILCLEGRWQPSEKAKDGSVPLGLKAPGQVVLLANESLHTKDCMGGAALPSIAPWKRSVEKNWGFWGTSSWTWVSCVPLRDEVQLHGDSSSSRATRAREIIFCVLWTVLGSPFVQTRAWQTREPGRANKGLRSAWCLSSSWELGLLNTEKRWI